METKQMSHNTFETQLCDLMLRLGNVNIQEAISILKTERLKNDCTFSKESALSRMINARNSKINLSDSIRSEAKNFIVSTPTQVGKINYVIEYCKAHRSSCDMIILNCDNNITQMKQLQERLVDAGVTSFPIENLEPTRAGRILNTNQSIIITMMNNAYQIKKLTDFIEAIRTESNPKKFCFIHDEVDMVNKSVNITDLQRPEIPISHRMWAKLINSLEGRNCDILRFWISEIPEKCSSISKITGDSIILPV